MKKIELPFEIETSSPEETENIGQILADAFITGEQIPRFIAMYGDLGVGKTSFTRGLCRVLCPTANVKSPTFALVNEYKCHEIIAGVKKVCHFDMYRVTDEDDLYSIGFYDYLREGTICIAEWCEKIPYALPEEYVKVTIDKIDFDCKRRITISIVQ